MFIYIYIYIYIYINEPRHGTTNSLHQFPLLFEKVFKLNICRQCSFFHNFSKFSRSFLSCFQIVTDIMESVSRQNFVNCFAKYVQTVMFAV